MICRIPVLTTLCTSLHARTGLPRAAASGCRIATALALLLLAPLPALSACHLKPFSGSEKSIMMAKGEGVKASLGLAWFPRGIPVTLDYYHRSLMGEPVVRYVASADLPEKVSLRLDHNPEKTFHFHLDRKMPEGKVTVSPATSLVGGEVFRVTVGPDIMSGVEITRATMKFTPHTPRISGYQLPYPGIFGRPGGRGWDVDASPDWSKVFGKGPEKSTQDALVARSQRIWCQFVEMDKRAGHFERIEMIDVGINLEGFFARLRRISPEFSAALIDQTAKDASVENRAGRLNSALISALHGTNDPERAAKIAARVLSKFPQKDENRNLLKDLNERYVLQDQLTELMVLGEEVGKILPADGETEVKFPSGLASELLAHRQALEKQQGYAAELHAIVERMHRLSMTGRVPDFDLLLLLDRSGSMNDVFDALKREVVTLLGDLSAIGSKARVGLRAYNRDGIANFPLRQMDGEGMEALAAFAQELRTASGDRHFSELLDDIVYNDPFRPEAARRIVLVFGDLDDNDGRAGGAARLLRERHAGTFVIPVWTSEKALPAGLTSLAALGGGTAVSFNARERSIAGTILSTLGLHEFEKAQR